jgi:hypothetical protein
LSQATLSPPSVAGYSFNPRTLPSVFLAESSEALAEPIRHWTKPLDGVLRRVHYTLCSLAVSSTSARNDIKNGGATGPLLFSICLFEVRPSSRFRALEFWST